MAGIFPINSRNVNVATVEDEKWKIVLRLCKTEETRIRYRGVMYILVETLLSNILSPFLPTATLCFYCHLYRPLRLTAHIFDFLNKLANQIVSYQQRDLIASLIFKSRQPPSKMTMARGRNLGKRRGPNRKRNPVQQLSRIGWSDLPLELREMILEALEESLQGGKAASYASVSKEWNRILEPYIFKRLKLFRLGMGKLQDFVTDRRRPFVQFIWFRFERKLSPDWGRVDLVEQKELDQLRFAYAVTWLFQILSEWDERKTGQPGIVLELSAFSEFDPDYSMKDTVPKELKNVDITENSDALNAVYEKPAIRQMRNLPADELRNRRTLGLRLIYEASSLPHVGEAPFPTVNLVTDLTLRRQMHSSFFAQYMGRLVKALPRLEFITFEPVCNSAESERG